MTSVRNVAAAALTFCVAISFNMASNVAFAQTSMTGVASFESRAIKPAGKPAKKPLNKRMQSAAEPVNWIQKASEELQGVKTTEGVLPTPATVVAIAEDHQSSIELTALRVGLTFEPYQPRGTGAFGVGESIAYDSLPGSVLGTVDLRWLPFVISESRAIIVGGYLAFGYSRTSLPLATPTGFKYDDVALNSMRIETGAAFGGRVYGNWSGELKLGLGRQSLIQTSRYSEVVGNFDRPYFAAIADIQYHILPKFAVLASVAKRSPIAAGTGSIGFDPLTVSGGILVQVR
jgi:hypothetical protein